jgi:hypothetical protein
MRGKGERTTHPNGLNLLFVLESTLTVRVGVGPQEGHGYGGRQVLPAQGTQRTYCFGAVSVLGVAIPGGRFIPPIVDEAGPPCTIGSRKCSQIPGQKDGRHTFRMRCAVGCCPIP